MKCKNYLLSLLENIPLWYEDVQSILHTKPLQLSILNDILQKSLWLLIFMKNIVLYQHRQFIIVMIHIVNTQLNNL